MAPPWTNSACWTGAGSSSAADARTDEPAFDVYLRRLGAPAEAHTDPAAFTRFALTHPLGLSRRDGEIARSSAAGGFHNQTLVVLAVV